MVSSLNGPSPMTVKELIERNDLADVQATYNQLGDRFLLVFRNDAKDNTGHRASTVTIPAHTVANEDGPPKTETSSIIQGALVYPIGLIRGSQLIISVGRLESNDVQLPDGSVSAFHAVFKVSLQKGLRVQDMHSTNGTYLNGVAVPPEGMGPSHALNSGDSLRFGSVSAMFINGEGLFEVLERERAK